MDLKETHSKTFHWIIDYFSNRQVTDFHILRPVMPSLQCGPQCGIVALYMASKTLKLTGANSVDQLMIKAISMGISKNGEMFSARWLAQLAEKAFNCSAQVHDMSKLSFQQLKKWIKGNYGLLVPYDSDKNSSPCMNEGRNAHWCFLLGFLVVKCDIPSEDGNHVLALQGKSKYVGVWNFEKLKASNLNLRQIDQRYRGYCITPEGGMEVGLRGKLIVLTKTETV
ncbi:Uncharacterized protein T07_15161 [Trichinella nelsoni]|uniref:Actin maturation protease n=1 Tax=Trichinella nelsoni TaxID=6336 RepID=A0A0V0RMT5_9BILA|nr:Uncharacterized protein T07_15161 [Trichinella nelsoni]